MTSGFGHFDGSHRENFCAAVLLLAMDVEPEVRSSVARLALGALALGDAELVAVGREARLQETDNENYARVDVWLLFDGVGGRYYVFLEVKTHEGWGADDVARQVRDQAGRALARRQHRIAGSVLLAPARLCDRVRALDVALPYISWQTLLAELRARSGSSLTTYAVQHIEEQMEHPPGLDFAMSPLEFERATTTIACLKQFLLDCVVALEATAQEGRLYMTPGDGRPRRSGGWAWHGLSVPFSAKGRRGRVGIYKYAEAPLGEAESLEALWLEVYLGDSDDPVVSTKFAPATLASGNLARARVELASVWAALNEGTATGGQAVEGGAAT